MARTVVGMFETYDAARDAANQLEAAGFTHAEVSMVASEKTRDEWQSRTGETAERTGIGAGVGAAMGGLAGLLIGIGALAIPGVGPLIAAGPIAAALTGAGVGAAAGGLIGALTTLGVPEEHAAYYAEGVQRGNTLVTVRTDEARAQAAADILGRCGAVDVDRERQTSQVRDEAYTTARREDNRETRIPVYEEDVQVGKREVEGGGVRVSSRVVETPVHEQVTLREEHLHVERRPVDQEVDPSALDRVEGGTIELTERSEEVVVGKRARLVEEVVISKDVEERTQTVNETARRTDVQVEEIGSRQQQRSAFDAYGESCRTHWQSRYAGTGQSYEDYEPAYQYGYNLATDDNYRDREWTEVEPHVARHWESSRPGTWQNVKDAVQHAWDGARGRRSTGAA